MIDLNNVSFNYVGEQREKGLKNINLHIKKGEVVLLCGASGCGKTTLTRMINGLIPHFYPGELTGEVTVDGKNPAKIKLQELAQTVGSVFQNPRSQFFSTNTTAEMAFGCENQGIEPAIIRERINKTVDELKLDKLMNRDIFQLSGGEKQKIACGSVSVTQNDIYVLDEPSSNLDIQAIEELKEQISYWKKAGKTIIIAEHRLYYLSELVDRFIYLQEGRITGDYRAEKLKKITTEKLNKMGLRPFSLGQIKLTAKEKNVTDKLILKDFHFQYKQAERAALSIQKLEIPKNAVIAIIGHNGAGKSTFARCLCGLEKKNQGKLIFEKKALDRKARLKKSYLVMQDVNHQLFTESVVDEVLLSMKNPVAATAHRYLEQMGILELASVHPLSLSGGQKQRVAIASALASEKELVVFDEPTSGLDLGHMQAVASCLTALAAQQKSIFVISHDFELLAHCCDYVIQLEQGRVVKQYSLTHESFPELMAFFRK